MVLIEVNKRFIQQFLRPLNYEVIKAFNGEDALAIINEVDVDLILLDVMMPNMDGYEVCRRLKANEVTRHIPVVMVTALGNVEDKIKGIEAGADDFLTKPPNIMELRARTKSLINLKKLNNNLTSIERVLFSLANTVDAKDAYTHGHVERVANMATGRPYRKAMPHGNALGILRNEAKEGKLDQEIVRNLEILVSSGKIDKKA